MAGAGTLAAAPSAWRRWQQEAVVYERPGRGLLDGSPPQSSAALHYSRQTVTSTLLAEAVQAVTPAPALCCPACPSPCGCPASPPAVAAAAASPPAAGWSASPEARRRLAGRLLLPSSVSLSLLLDEELPLLLLEDELLLLLLLLELPASSLPSAASWSASSRQQSGEGCELVLSRFQQARCAATVCPAAAA